MPVRGDRIRSQLVPGHKIFDHTAQVMPKSDICFTKGSGIGRGQLAQAILPGAGVGDGLGDFHFPVCNGIVLLLRVEFETAAGQVDAVERAAGHQADQAEG